VLAELEAAGLVVLADKGYQGSTWAKIPYKGRNKPGSQKQANKAHARLHKCDFAGSLARRPARQGHPRIADPRDGIGR